ncbi:dual specificity tyrosine-phosphorylation-regulated kinase 1a [Anaeramoeba ignava]|uniref:Dual specificity tyrosine-phosphorylation-regulated kinase 1a n=1 Tax=Anaeramoeba ignava TaxID=1746090 RepID=A0A9Q0LA15_ANAIG|nr:dual specificity tyrosine-phosphorylation-regulated kinase 1a [Anaeramoeba ignava]
MDSSPNQTNQKPREIWQRPLINLSVGLLNTYKKINLVYYAEKRKKSKTKEQNQASIYNNGYDDENYNYIVRLGELIADRYEVISFLGRGSFGKVVKAIDRTNNQLVAIKIIKSKRAFYNQGLLEKEILEKLSNFDPKDEHHTVRLLDSFVYHNHLCLIFELLSVNIYELLRNTKFQGVSLNLVAKFSIQILDALQYLDHKNIKIVHCDLKPENILLVSPRRSSIKVIDFGSSCSESKRIHTYIQSRFYRSPEVLLQMEYTTSIDMWSMGCILVELHTGQPLFPGRNEMEQMTKIVEVLGVPPAHILNNAPKAQKFFKLDQNNQWVLKDPHFERKNLDDIIGVFNGGPYGTRKDTPGHTEFDYLKFRDLVFKMLDYDPKTRIKPGEAKKHSFFKITKHVSTQIPNTKIQNDNSKQIENIEMNSFISKQPNPDIKIEENNNSIQIKNNNSIQIKNNNSIQMENNNSIQIENDSPIQIENDNPIQIENNNPIQMENDNPIQMENDNSIQIENDNSEILNREIQEMQLENIMIEDSYQIFRKFFQPKKEYRDISIQTEFKNN